MIIYVETLTQHLHQPLHIPVPLHHHLIQLDLQVIVLLLIQLDLQVIVLLVLHLQLDLQVMVLLILHLQLVLLVQLTSQVTEKTLVFISFGPLSRS